MMTVTGQPQLAQTWMRRVRRIHLLGIGGSGMAGIAEVLLNLGYTVTGSDLKESAATRRLTSLGATVIAPMLKPVRQMRRLVARRAQHPSPAFPAL